MFVTVRECPIAGEHGAPVYRIGTTPWGRSMLVIGDAALIAVNRKGEILGLWATEDVDIVILSPAAGAVSIVIAARGQFIEVSLVPRPGPVAPAWSWDRLLERRALEGSVRRDLIERGYGVAEGTA